MAAYVHGQPVDDGEEGQSKRTGKVSSAETTPTGREPINWVVLEKTMGLIPAQIMADRLRYDGIQARATQQGAGAFGLTVGILGEGRVYVPEEQEAEAREILAAIAEEPLDWGEDDSDESPHLG